MMLEKDTNELLTKYREGKATAREKAILEQWYLDNHAVNPLADQIDLEAAQQKSLKTIMNQISPPKSINWGHKLAVAASVILVLGIGIYFFNLNSKPPGILTVLQAENAKNDIPPGKNAATLTLANGRQIKLSAADNGILAKEAGISITKTADGQLVYRIESSSTSKNRRSEKESLPAYNTLSTSTGEQYQVILPDQTKVWLNASSSIRYATSFARGGNRLVTLMGEAYFEVAKMKIPFLVSTKYQTIQVLGTHFNINSYENEPDTKTTLLEGSVQVSSPAALRGGTSIRSSNMVLLKPGQQSILTDRRLKVIAADTEQETSWKNGQFYFRNTPLKAVMRQISRWYDVEVVYHKEVSDQVMLGGWISRSKKISAILNLIELTGQAHFKVEGRRITVMP